MDAVVARVRVLGDVNNAKIVCKPRSRGKDGEYDRGDYYYQESEESNTVCLLLIAESNAYIAFPKKKSVVVRRVPANEAKMAEVIKSVEVDDNLAEYVMNMGSKERIVLSEPQILNQIMKIIQ